MTGLEVFGILLIILGVVGMTVMLRGKRPAYGKSSSENGQKRDNQGKNK